MKKQKRLKIVKLKMEFYKNLIKKQPKQMRLNFFIALCNKFTF